MSHFYSACVGLVIVRHAVWLSLIYGFIRVLFWPRLTRRTQPWRDTRRLQRFLHPKRQQTAGRSAMSNLEETKQRPVVASPPAAITCIWISAEIFYCTPTRAAFKSTSKSRFAVTGLKSKSTHKPVQAQGKLGFLASVVIKNSPTDKTPTLLCYRSCHCSALPSLSIILGFFLLIFRVRGGEEWETAGLRGVKQP